MGAAESTTSRVTVGWEEAERETPEGFEVLYPPPPLGADALKRLAEVAYAEWTEDEQLRQTAFLGWRDDKNAKEVSL
jgi:ATP-dependent DNA ligase